MDIKTLISGLGNIGMMYDYSSNKKISHSKYISSNKNFNLIAGVDKKKSQRKLFKKKYKKPAFSDLFKAIEFTKPDLVIIAHEEKKIERLKKLLKYDFIKHLIIEKPFIISLKK